MEEFDDLTDGEDDEFADQFKDEAYDLDDDSELLDDHFVDFDEEDDDDLEDFGDEDFEDEDFEDLDDEID